jgi:hypothetical protein
MFFLSCFSHMKKKNFEFFLVSLMPAWASLSERAVAEAALGD